MTRPRDEPAPSSPRLRQLRIQRLAKRKALAQLRADINALTKAIRHEEAELATKRATHHAYVARQVIKLIEQGIDPVLIAETLGLPIDDVEGVIDERASAGPGRPTPDDTEPT